MTKEELIKIANETITIVKEGQYLNPDGEVIDILEDQLKALEGTVHVRPEDFEKIFSTLPSPKAGTIRIEVTEETTLHACRRLAVAESVADVACLNFASAKTPGGAFLLGFDEQEETLARASGLHACLQRAEEFYNIHKRSTSFLYTDNMIYSPGVPVFRAEDNAPLFAPHRVSFISSPAVNKGAMLTKGSTSVGDIEPVMRARMEKILALAVFYGHRVLVLGAWGCGPMKNDPSLIAKLFRQYLIDEPRFHGLFDRIVFAIPDRAPDKPIFTAFKDRFAREMSITFNK